MVPKSPSGRFDGAAGWRLLLAVMTVSIDGLESTVTMRLNRRGRLLLTVLLSGLVMAAAVVFGRTSVPAVTGLEPGMTIGAAATSLSVEFDRVHDPSRISVFLDGHPFEVEMNGPIATVVLDALEEGPHTLVVSADGWLADDTASIGFNVDLTAPVMRLLGPLDPVRVSESMSIEFAIDDPDAEVTVGGRPAPVKDGKAVVEFALPPRTPVEARAVDPYGNETVEMISIPVRLAGAPGQPPIRGVHATGYTWATASLRQPILDAIAAGRINTVQLDLKDESGLVWYNTGVGLAHQMGAVTELWNLEQVVAELHALDVRVIGRIVNFRDPVLATYAVDNGHMDWVVQNPDGTAFAKYDGFANPYNHEVWEYNILLAEEAVRLGVDDILFDYVRRPDHAIEDMRFPGRNGSPEDAIVAFLTESERRIHATGGRLGASVFGIAATRPTEIAQDIPRISEVVDYVAPMVYPSHWGPGEYGVKDPNSQPYDIVYASMLDFMDQVGGAGIVVWLQDFSLGVTYGEAEVRAQIEAASQAGVDSFLLWDPKATYTWSALG